MMNGMRMWAPGYYINFVIILLIITVDKEYSIKVKPPRDRHWIDYVIFIVALLLLVSGKYVVGIIHMILAVSGYAVNRRTTIKVSDPGIIYPSFPSKKFGWSDIENVVLKDGVLTIDLKNNKLFQLMVLDSAEAGKIETEFNAYVFEMQAQASTTEPILN